VTHFGIPWPKYPFLTWMTAIRLSSGDLFIYSPTPLTPSLRTEVEGVGRVHYIIGPNRIHYWWFPEWKAAFPYAGVYLAWWPALRSAANLYVAAQMRIGCGGRNYARLESRAPHPGAWALAPRKMVLPNYVGLLHGCAAYSAADRCCCQLAARLWTRSHAASQSLFLSAALLA